MRQLYITLTLTIFLACSKQSNDSARDSSDTVTADKGFVTPAVEPEKVGNYLSSTYDSRSPQRERNETGLRELSDSSVFSTIHNKLVLTLDPKLQDFFKSNSHYEIILSASGNLFQTDKEDHAFFVYDKIHSRPSILVYDAAQNKYSELFRKLKVRNGLDKAECNYGAYGTLDFQLAKELIYMREYLVKNPIKQIENFELKIVNIFEDDVFALSDGCFAPGFSDDRKTRSLCIPTSAVYNNWECLTYDKNKGEFIIFYGQAFAD